VFANENKIDISIPRNQLRDVHFTSLEEWQPLSNSPTHPVNLGPYVRNSGGDRGETAEENLGLDSHSFGGIGEVDPYAPDPSYVQLFRFHRTYRNVREDICDRSMDINSRESRYGAELP
jgi:hypothetical protein